MSNQLGVSYPVFDTLQASILEISKAKTTEFGIPAPVMVLFNSNSVAWGGYWAISKFKKLSNSIDRENTKAMRSKYIKFLRPFIKQYFYDNPLVSDADIIKAGLQPHSKAYQRSSSTSAEIPDVTSTPKAGHLMNFTCLNSSGKKRKPAKIVFFRIKWHAGANPPSDPVMFTRFKDFSAHPIQIIFDAADAGKALVYSVCYVTSKGPEAPFTNIITTTVP